MQPIPLKWSVARWCYFLSAAPTPIPLPTVVSPFTFSFTESLSLTLSPLPLAGHLRLIARNLWYDSAFSTVFAVSFFFIPLRHWLPLLSGSLFPFALYCYVGLYLCLRSFISLSLPLSLHPQLYIFHLVFSFNTLLLVFRLSFPFYRKRSVTDAPIQFLRLKRGHTNLMALSNRDALDPVYFFARG